MPDARYDIDDLLRVMQRLRDPVNGCPWDLEQDFHSIVPSTLEECYELAQAIEDGEFDHVAEELGDVLFQVVFYAQMGRERGLFSFEQVVDTLVDKLLRRHPHVFADGGIEDVPIGSTSIEEVGQSWELIKQAEREVKDRGGVLDDVPHALPALPRAQKLQKRAARVGFDWAEAEDVLCALEAEVGELREAMRKRSRDNVAEEMGDILFSCVNLARHMGLDAESTLRRSSAKFERRFRLMEGYAQEHGQHLSQLSPAQLEVLWCRAKEALARGL